MKNKFTKIATGFLALASLFFYSWWNILYLPLILIEMERGIPSLWGSVDQCTLVMVSAGICAANLINPLINSD